VCLSEAEEEEERKLRGEVLLANRGGGDGSSRAAAGQVLRAYVPNAASPTAFAVRQRSVGVWGSKRQSLEVRAAKVERSQVSRVPRVAGVLWVKGDPG
jgi:hypothetical protein